MRRVILRKSLHRNGITPRNVSTMGISFANLLITKTFRPTGGVIKPTSTAISVRMPNQIAVSSVLMPKFKLTKIGKNIGTVNSIIARLSIKQPRKKYKSKINANIKYGDRPELKIHDEILFVN